MNASLRGLFQLLFYAQRYDPIIHPFIHLVMFQTRGGALDGHTKTPAYLPGFVSVPVVYSELLSREECQNGHPDHLGIQGKCRVRRE
jgi:hypothetical protein